MTASPDDNKSSTHKYYVQYQEGAMTNLADFKKHFENYMKFNHRNVNWKWTADYTPFLQLGYNVEYIQMCKSCNKEAKKGCCENYHAANRSKRFLIQNMKIVSVETGNDSE